MCVMDAKNFEQARQYVIQRLEQELSPNLHYHGIAHTQDDVVPAVETLATMEEITGESFFLLLTAAWFHDLGFVDQALYHELISVRYAAEVLPSFGYTAEQIEIIRWIIYATILPQTPQTHLERIMADADLDVLGRDDFLLSNGNLRRELAFAGKDYSDAEWYAGQIKFIEGHTYFTTSAGILRNAGQTKNIAELKKKLAEIE